jgi:hypothetical protein
MPQTQGPNILGGLFYEFSIPLGLANILQTVIGHSQNDPNTPEVVQARAPREWYSQPRPCTDTTTEVLTVNFKLPLPVEKFGFQALRVPCNIQVQYQDRNNNWIPLTDANNNPISLNLTYSAVTNWYNFQTDTYPIVGKAVRLLIKRTFDPQMGNSPYVTGIKEMLVGYTIYTPEQTTPAITSQQDSLGNTITSYVKHWDASNVLDNDPNTFWKSFPCPDPNGVVSLYLDTRDANGNPQLIDTVYIDPVYTGNTLNLYYSNDPTQGTLIISRVSLPPDTQTNANWTLGVGMVDASGADLSDSQLTFPVAFGPLVSEPVWIGIEWTPDFNPSSGPPDNPILFSTTPLNPTAAAAAGQYWVQVYYDVGAGYITLEFTNGTTTHNYHVALSPVFVQGVPLQIVVGWAYNPSVVFISVTSQKTTVLGTTTVNPATSLPHLITLDGEAGYTNFRGLMTALVVKQEAWTNGAAAFQASPTIYANPNPVQPDSQGNYPSTSLDNAMLAVDWTSQQFPIGGTHESWYENKVWTPIFGNYFTQKGNLFLPQKTSISYLKLEFTNLTSEPYPVYDQGISVIYDVYPVSVIQTSTTRSRRDRDDRDRDEGLLTIGDDIITSSIGSLNWFNPSTIQNAVNSNWGRTQQNVTVVTGPGTTSTSLPNTVQSNIQNSYRSEMSNPWIYRRQLPNPTYLAGQQLTAIGNSPDSAQTLQSSTTGSTSTQVANTFTPVTTTTTSNVLPQQGKDWWLFPGANLKMPASVMRALTDTDVDTRRGSSTATRVRFTTTSVHRYNTNTVTLDAAVAYFAGLSEVQTYVTTYIASNDPLSFSYSQYDPITFVYTNINQETTGPLTTAGSPYVFQNPNFEYPLELSPWTATGDWTWDSQHGPGSENGQGDEPCAAIVADGNPNTLVSEPIAVAPGANIVITALVAYYGAVSSSGGALSISGVTYNGGVQVGTVTFAMPTMTTTYTVATQAAMLALSATTGQSATITTGAYQGTWYLQQTPASTFSNWLQTGYGTLINQPTGDINGRRFIQLIGTYTVPGSGVDHLAVSLDVNGTVTAGNTYWSDVQMNPAAGIEGTVFLNAVTTSTFADVTVNINDSGLLTSDAMWARADPLDTNISNLQLAPYVNTIPSIIPSGTWADTFAKWDDTTIEWGEPQGVVAINVDQNLIFQGNRAVHFTRAAGAGEAGLLITQQTNMLSQELAQLGCVFYKPTANTNQIILRLRRVSDGVYIHSETFDPVVGYWYTYLSQFFELPDTPDQVYTVEMVLTGDDADELFVSNVYTSVAGIRYFMQLGDSGTFLFDVTPLCYGSGECNVSCTAPVQELSLTVGAFNPNSWAYGISLVPRYLK